MMTRTQTAMRAAVAMLLAVAGSAVWGASLTYDSTPLTPGVLPDPNSGNWETTTNNWYDGTMHIWDNLANDTAVFRNPQGGPRGYTVTATTPVTVGGLQFSGYYGYTLAASGTGAINLGLANTPVTVDNPATYGDYGTISAPITGSGGMTFSGAGYFVVSGVNSYTGATVVNNLVRLRHSSALGTADGGTTVNSGGQVLFDNPYAGSGTCPDAFALNGGTLFNNAPGAVTCSGLVTVNADNTRIYQTNFGGRQMTFTGGIVNNGVNLNMTIDSGGSATFNLNSNLSGSGTVNFGNCTVNVNYGITFAGPLIANNSILYIPTAGAGALNTATLTLNSGSELRIQNNVNPGNTAITLNNSLIWAFQNNMTLNNPLTLTGAGTIRSHNFGSDATLQNSTITLGSNTLTLINADYTGFVGSGHIYVTDKITGAGNVVCGNGVDDGWVYLSNAANDYTGSTTVASGRLQATVNGAIPSGSDVVVNSTNVQGLDVPNGLALTIGSLAGTGYVNTETSGALTVGANNHSTTFSGQIRGSGTVTKTGAGTLLLSGTNTYTGATTVTDGTLAVGGSLTTSGITVNNNATLRIDSPASLSRPITIAAGGTVGGTGSLGSSLSIPANAIVAPGASTGTMTLTAGASFANGAVYNWELGPNNLTIDLLRVSSGNLAFGSSMVLNVVQYAGSQPIVGTDYVLLNYAGATLTSAAPTWTINYVSGGYYGASVVNDSANSRFLLTGLLPEPGALTLLAAGAVALLRRRR